LNKNPTAKKRIPKRIPLELKEDSSVIPENNFANSSKCIKPVNP
jgi:hypothetical protein